MEAVQLAWRRMDPAPLSLAQSATGGPDEVVASPFRSKPEKRHFWGQKSSKTAKNRPKSKKIDVFVIF